MNLEEMIPCWSGSNANLCFNFPDMNAIRYWPNINGSFVEFRIIYTLGKIAQKMVQGLKQKDCVITFEIAFYIEVIVIQLRLPEKAQLSVQEDSTLF